ncbi:MAG: hypothetical protein KAI53_02510 [Candidatus Aenigmarchaeota archaeon]|nr:hypothetical protein [Candidatus Aenigmarchaeota archaeon]
MVFKRSKKGGTITYLLVFILGFLVAAGLFLEYHFIFDSAPTGHILKNAPAIAGTTRAETSMVAISKRTEKGVIGKIVVEVADGKDSVLVDIHPFIEPEMQNAALMAVKYAKTHTNRNMENKTIIYRFVVDKNTILIGGPSAGPAMAAATVAAIEGKKIKEDAIVTGELRADGTIASVGSVLEKSEAAGLNNFSLFLIPKGQGEITYYEKEETSNVFFGIDIGRTKLVPKKLNLESYALGQWNMQVKEAETMDDVLKEMILDESAN